MGKDQLESFQYYDIAATFRLPWEYDFYSGWGVGTRLLASGGILEGANKYALVAAAVPVLAFGRLDGRLSVDAGAGLAVFSNHRFAQQTYGGPLQFAVTLGAGIPLYGPLGAGFRYLHYSDAGLYGDHTIGADFQIIELTYHF